MNWTVKDINGKGVYKSTKTGNIYKLTDEGLKIDKTNNNEN